MQKRANNWVKMSASFLFLLLVLPVVYSFIYVSLIERQFPATGDKINIMGVDAHVKTIDGIKATDETAPIIMIHGASSNGREMLYSLAPSLKDFQILIPDRAGHGYSGRPKDAQTMAVQAKFIAQILDAKGIKSAVIVGHSWGSAVSLRLALDRPDLVKSLVLIAPATHPWPGGTSRINRLAASPILGKWVSWAIPSVMGPALMPAGIKEGFAPAPVTPNYQKNVGLELVLRPETFRANAIDLDAGTFELGEQAKRYHNIKVPISIIAGGGDKIVTNAIHADALAKEITQARVYLVPNSGHMPHWAKTETVADIISAYAGQNPYPSNQEINGAGVRVLR